MKHPNKSCEYKKIPGFTFFIVDILDLHDTVDYKSVRAFIRFRNFIVNIVEIRFTRNINCIQQTYTQIQNTECLIFF